MIPNTMSLPSLPSTNSLGSIASLGSIGMGLACAVATVSGSVIPSAESNGRALDDIYLGVEAGAGNSLDSEVVMGFENIRNGSALKVMRPRAPQEGEGDGSASTQSALAGGGRAEVITTCSVPGTAALTFVSLD
jgi:hypothetical protein